MTKDRNFTKLFRNVTTQTNNKENANRIHNEIPLHTHWNGCKFFFLNENVDKNGEAGPLIYFW